MVARTSSPPGSILYAPDEEMSKLSDKKLASYTDKFKKRLEEGETLDDIASFYKVSIDLIKSNNLGTENLEEGDCLFLPFVNTVVHTVRPLETLSKIARMYNVSEKYILEKNGVKEIFVGQKLYM